MFVRFLLDLVPTSVETWDVIVHITMFGGAVALLIIETRSKGISRRDSAYAAFALIFMASGIIHLLERHVF